jgi:hypothetical protein
MYLLSYEADRTSAKYFGDKMLRRIAGYQYLIFGVSTKRHNKISGYRRC